MIYFIFNPNKLIGAYKSNKYLFNALFAQHIRHLPNSDVMIKNPFVL